MGWFGVQSNIAGSSFAKIMSIYFDSTFSPRICSFIIGILMMLTAVMGIKYLKYLNYIAVPAKILLLTFGVILSFHGKSFGTITSYLPPEPMDFLTAIGLSIGFISVGGVISPDYARFAKTKKDVLKGTILGLLPAGITLLGVGSMLAILQNTYDIVEIFSKFGYPFMALLILIVATWTTNVMNAYSSGLALNQLFHLPEKKRYLSTIIAGVLGCGLAAMGIMDKFMGFLMILTITVPPVAGVLISDYFVSKNFKPDTIQAFNWKGILAWVLGVSVMLVMDNPIKNVLGIVVSLVSYWLFSVLVKEKNEEQLKKE
jgi:cytosine permease